jgi:His/Glu/Gln/Arg/opine family amino acid ABC transporter permease subunit
MSASLFSYLLVGAKTTLIVTVGAWFVSALVGLLLALALEIPSKSVRIGVEFVVNVLRGVPQLLVLFILYFGLSSYGLHVGSLMAAIVGLGVTEAGNTTEYYRAGFFTVGEKQREAGYSLGLTRFGALRYIVIPQVVPFMIPPLLNTFVGLLKLSTLASAVGAPEVIYRSQLYMNNYGKLGIVSLAVIVLFVVATMPLLWGTAALERRLRQQM